MVGLALPTTNWSFFDEELLSRLVMSSLLDIPVSLIAAESRSRHGVGLTAKFASDCNSAWLRKAAAWSPKPLGVTKALAAATAAAWVVADDREIGQPHRLSGRHGEIVGPRDVVADEAHRRGLQAARAVDVVDDGRRAACRRRRRCRSSGRWYCHGACRRRRWQRRWWPRRSRDCRRSVTVVVIGEPVELVKVSTVRAKSSLPVLGTVTSRLTVSPASVPLAVTTALAAVGRAIGRSCWAGKACRRPSGGRRRRRRCCIPGRVALRRSSHGNVEGQTVRRSERHRRRTVIVHHDADGIAALGVATAKIGPAVAVEVAGYDAPSAVPPESKLVASRERARAIAKEDHHIAAVMVGHGQIGVAVAVEIADDNGLGPQSAAIEDWRRSKAARAVAQEDSNRIAAGVQHGQVDVPSLLKSPAAIPWGQSAVPPALKVAAARIRRCRCPRGFPPCVGRCRWPRPDRACRRR